MCAPHGPARCSQTDCDDLAAVIDGGDRWCARHYALIFAVRDDSPLTRFRCAAVRALARADRPLPSAA